MQTQPAQLEDDPVAFGPKVLSSELKHQHKSVCCLLQGRGRPKKVQPGHETDAAPETQAAAKRVSEGLGKHNPNSSSAAAAGAAAVRCSLPGK